MIYSKELENMCCVAKGVDHGPAPIPEEGKWVKAKDIKDISGLTHGIGWCAPQQGACKLTLNVKDGIIQEEFIKKISVAFLERKPQFIETDNPYTAAKFYKDLADSDFSLYTKKDYQRVSRLLASVALHNGRITETSQDGQVITFTFSFSSQGNYEEFLENVKVENTVTN